MKRKIFIPAFLLCFIVFATAGSLQSKNFKTLTINPPDTLPSVLPANKSDIVEGKLRNEAFTRFATLQLPDNLKEWEDYRVNLRNTIIEKTGVYIDHALPVDMKETSTLQMPGYIIKNIYFQTLPGIYATANLYIPDGEGPFPGVILMCGHSSNGRLYDAYQSVGHSLALNGYVALAIDPWGAGERTTTHTEFEYHGANLGASLMNIGKSLIGMQISDNIRGVDLLCSLPYVDPDKIGATGASGGGNQTMWVAAMDNRIKAAVPVVSVGSFESYVMRSNCICETLIDGLTFTEEAGILALANAIMPCNHEKDSNPAFAPSEMLRSYSNAKKIFILKNQANNISYRIFDLTHGYHPEPRAAMIGWFNQKLKGIGTGEAITEKPFTLVTAEKLMTFGAGNRDAKVINTAEYCKNTGNQLRDSWLKNKTFNVSQKRDELATVLRISEKPEIVRIHEFSIQNGWERIALETSDNKLIPLLISAPSPGADEYVILTNIQGKNEIPVSLINEYKKRGKAVVLADLTGTGEASSARADAFDRQRTFHTIARAEIWLGKTTIGEWIKEIDLITRFIKSSYNAKKITVDGTKETGLAGLFLSSLENNIDEIILRDAPVSYLFDNRESIDFFSMAVHIPGFLTWGDISLAAGITGKNITFINPVTMSGQKISGTKLQDLKKEFETVRNACKQAGVTTFE